MGQLTVRERNWKCKGQLAIVLIVTGFLNEATPFSLFNAAQILSNERRIKVGKDFF